MPTLRYGKIEMCTYSVIVEEQHDYLNSANNGKAKSKYRGW